MSMKLITHKNKKFNPVTIELTFETRAQLAAFVALYGNMEVSATTIAENTYNIEYTQNELSYAIDSTIRLNDYRTLRSIVSDTKD